MIAVVRQLRQLERPPLNNMKCRPLISLVAVALVLLLFYALHRADRSSRVRSSSTSPLIKPAHVGTWLCETGYVFQFRSDGTGRSHDPGVRPPKIKYFEWTLNGSSLTLHYVPRGLVENFIARHTTHQTDDFRLRTVNSDEFTLELKDATRRFSRTNDVVLDADP